jgi:hypothetical protein
MSVNIHSIKSSQLVIKMSLIVQKHFTLKSTTVTGIPMKVNLEQLVGFYVPFPGKECDAQINAKVYFNIWT